MQEQQLFTDLDLHQLSEHGIGVDEAICQVSDIRMGFPYLDIVAPASLEYGVVRVEKHEEADYMDAWDEYMRSPRASVCKMVPASGAASRMFKSLYSFLDGADQVPSDPVVVRFFEELPRFAFYDRLGEVCLRNAWRSIPKLIAAGEYKTIVRNLLLEEGLNYGASPKGLLLFHSYKKGSSTAAEEHLVEGALYAAQPNGHVDVHFTVSGEHRTAFERKTADAKRYHEDKYGVFYDISFSEQKSSTDTLALTPEGELFRKEDGTLIFRPGGHGALISNLGDLKKDIVFIKNIDNVVPDHLRGATIMYKKFLGGILLGLRERIHGYLKDLDKGRSSSSLLEEIVGFFEQTLCITVPESIRADEDELRQWLYTKLHRPVRVCGMVRNSGEPGGGPFVIREVDGSTSLQILESTQINMRDEQQRAHLEGGTYFNPVDLVCALTDHRGQKYQLEDFVNPRTAFIASKSYNGRELKALERPGLWNGAMHHWNTLFVEVPAETFNPVKEVNDLLRPEHQGA
ncbi:MAG: DUF4301 family protein [Porphyromonadaceae bacterium]|nr:DUF4301 family protein [Porphyromonadaceae bacterium]